MKPHDENYSLSHWIHLVKPVAFNMELILSRIGDTLLPPGTALRKCCAWVAESATNHHARASQFVQHHLSIWSVVMTIDIDHVIVPTRDRSAAAKRLAGLLGVSWAGAGPFSAVYVNESLTLDFVETEGTFAPHHYCFRVEEKEFNAILGRLNKAGINYRGATLQSGNGKPHCGSNIYWEEPDGHQWEVLLAVNHAQQVEMST